MFDVLVYYNSFVICTECNVNKLRTSLKKICPMSLTWLRVISYIRSAEGLNIQCVMSPSLRKQKRIFRYCFIAITNKYIKLLMTGLTFSHSIHEIGIMVSFRFKTYHWKTFNHISAVNADIALHYHTFTLHE